MTILDAVVPVCCDGKGCSETIDIQPEFRYRDYSGKSGAYDTSDEAIEKKLLSENWIVVDGKHYCCESCVPDEGQEGASK